LTSGRSSQTAEKGLEECWKSLHTAKTLVIVERTWRFHLQKYISIPYDENIADSMPIANDETAFLLRIAIDEQEANHGVIGFTLINPIQNHRSIL